MNMIHEPEPPIKWYLTIFLELSKEDTKKEEDESRSNIITVSSVSLQLSCQWNDSQISKRIVIQFYLFIFLKKKLLICAREAAKKAAYRESQL